MESGAVRRETQMVVQNFRVEYCPKGYHKLYYKHINDCTICYVYEREDYKQKVYRCHICYHVIFVPRDNFCQNCLMNEGEGIFKRKIRIFHGGEMDIH